MKPFFLPFFVLVSVPDSIQASTTCRYNSADTRFGQREGLLNIMPSR
jgi:hypothetical protein